MKAFKLHAAAKRCLKVLTATAFIGLCCFASPAWAAEQPFTDVPSDHWAAPVIEELRTLGFSDGIGNGAFGLGQVITRAEFASFICKVEGFDGNAAQAYTDNTDTGAWYYGAVNAMAAHRVTAPDGAFRPNEPITRAEMAEMIVGALGLYDLGTQLNSVNCPFTDVKERKGFITLASDLKLVGGMSANTFAPSQTATREEAAAMLVRLYHCNQRQLEEVHGFYAISSASQSSFLNQLDSTGFGWARLTLNNGHAVVNTSAANGNEYNIPAGFTQPVAQARSNGGKALLSIYADNNNGLLTQILSQPTLRTEAIQQIITTMNNAQRDQQTVSFDGVVIDFESLRAGQKANYSTFLKELRSALGNKQLYVAVHPVLSGSAYYDGYDYDIIGQVADRVILMAYDYATRSLSESEMAQGYTQTPLSPLNQVYISIKACLAGGIPNEKLLLGMSMDTVQWKLQNGAVIHNTPYHPSYDAVQARLATGCQVAYPNYSYNPYATYTDTTDRTQNVLWFENEQSVKAKAQLARLLQLRGLSLWRLGTIPTDSNTGLNIWQAVQSSVQ